MNKRGDLQVGVYHVCFIKSIYGLHCLNQLCICNTLFRLLRIDLLIHVVIDINRERICHGKVLASDTNFIELFTIFNY